MFEDLEHAALMAGIRKGLKQAFIEAGEKARHPYRGNQFGKDKGTGKGSGTSGEVTSPAYRHTKEAQPGDYVVTNDASRKGTSRWSGQEVVVKAFGD